MNIKKCAAVFLAVMVIVFAFSACSSEDNDNKEATTNEITTDEAVVKDADAINLIKTYTAEELGLEGSLDDYKIMVASNGEEIENELYIRVIAAKVSETGDDGSVHIDTYGQYYISFDGEKILVYNKDTQEYTPMKDVHDVPAAQTSTEYAQPEE